MEKLTIVQIIAVWALPILFAITIHEAAHGWIASLLGDETAKQLGRVTLNPLKHIDLVGTILLPVFMLIFSGFVFGWAKPVPINWQNLKNPRRDMAFVALAGPLSNLLMAICWGLIGKLGLILTQHGVLWAKAVFFMGKAGIFINLLLMIINLIPIPPLDGSRVIYSFLPIKITEKLKPLEIYGLVILLLLFVLGILAFIIYYPIMFLLNWLQTLLGLN